LLLTVTPNPALDKTYLVDRLIIGRVHRPLEIGEHAGGKGINVARAAVSLGLQSSATGFLAGHNGDLVRNRLEPARIEDGFVTVPGQTRLCIAIVYRDTGTQTEINEPGPTIDQAALDLFQERFSALLERSHTVALCGSLPPGVPDGFYAGLIGQAKSRGIRTVLDTSGEPLRHGLDAVPDFVKPNATEASDLLGREIETVGDAAEACRIFLERGVKTVAITLGRCGAVGADETGAWYAEAPEIQFASAVGSGDVFLAAFLVKWLQGADLSERLQFASAAGAANAMVYGAGVFETHTVQNLTSRISVTRL